MTKKSGDYLDMDKFLISRYMKKNKQKYQPRNEHNMV